MCYVQYIYFFCGGQQVFLVNMQIFHSYGESGMGDFVSSTSFFLTYCFKEDSHIIFHLPIEPRQYEQLIRSVLDMWGDLPYKLTYEFDCTGAFRNYFAALDQFTKLPDKDQCKFLYRHDVNCTQHAYHPSKKQWEKNVNGPIALYIDHSHQKLENQQKFFNKQDTVHLICLIDDKDYFCLGKHHTFEKNMDIMSKCRYVIGLEGGWTHVSNSMRVPYIICANQRPLNEIKQYHSKHPSLQIIKTDDMHKYLVL